MATSSNPTLVGPYPTGYMTLSPSPDPSAEAGGKKEFSTDNTQQQASLGQRLS
jgi:hypothetical protein